MVPDAATTVKINELFSGALDTDATDEKTPERFRYIKLVALSVAFITEDDSISILLPDTYATPVAIVKTKLLVVVPKPETTKSCVMPLLYRTSLH